MSWNVLLIKCVALVVNVPLQQLYVQRISAVVLTTNVVWMALVAWSVPLMFKPVQPVRFSAHKPGLVWCVLHLSLLVLNLPYVLPIHLCAVLIQLVPFPNLSVQLLPLTTL